MHPQDSGYFQHPEDDDAPHIPDLIRGVPVQTLSETVTLVAEILAGMLNVETPGGTVVIHELVAAEKEKGLRCWQFSFGQSDDQHVMECAEECTYGVSNFLHNEAQDKISSVQFSDKPADSEQEVDLDPGTIADPFRCKLALSAQGFADPKANEALVVALARYFQWIDADLEKKIIKLSNNQITNQLLSLKFFS